VSIISTGLSHKTVPIGLREKFYTSAEALPAILSKIKKDSKYIEEIAIVSTCNRFEIYAKVNNTINAKVEIVKFLTDHFLVNSNSLSKIRYISKILYSNDEQNAYRHLMEVASGLDSMIVGEDQILGQVQSALEISIQAGTAGTFIHRLFESSLRAGKRARTETEISQNTTSLSHAAVQLMLEVTKSKDPNVLVIGAGEMAEQSLYALHKLELSNLSILNRTFKKASEIGDKYGVNAYEWSELENKINTADVIFTAMSIDKAMFTKKYFNKTKKEKCIIDLGLPRNVKTEVVDIKGISLYDLDSLEIIVSNNFAAREACIPKVNQIIEQEANKFNKWILRRESVPYITKFRSEVQSLVEKNFDGLLEKNTSKTMAFKIMNEVLHEPTQKISSTQKQLQTEPYAEEICKRLNDEIAYLEKEKIT
jgi:glutamyl-tRNA reductase|tara:strand:+ start:2070 stop:3338 length:1269 start_codon:yes stop_codon:yes gene_type:complete